MIPLLAMSVALAEEPTERFALLVGHNDGGPERVKLRFAHADANGLASVLEELGGVPAANDTVLLDPSRQELLAEFERLRLRLQASPNAELLFYYSGHSDEEGLLLGAEAVGYRELRALLDNLPARVRIGILDSCASGAMILTKGGTSVPAFLRDESAKVDGTAYITSSSADEVAQEADRIGGSFFTHYLTAGLRGAADATGDGRVTLHEAYAYANAETLAQTERTQHGPQHATHLYQISGTGELVLTDLTLTSATLVLDEAIAGRASIRDESGLLVLELNKVGGRPVELGLTEGLYTVTLQGDRDQYAEARVELTVGASTLVAAEALVWHTGLPTVARGDEPPVAVLAPPPDLEERLLLPRFGFLPGVPAVREGTDTMVMSLVADRSRDLQGYGTALAGYQVDGEASGVVATMGWTRVGELDGAQLTLGANWSERAGKGFQGSMGANVAEGGGDIVQATTGVNVATGHLKGAQLSAGVNVAEGGFRGIQATSGVNVATADSFGAQLGGALNIARGFEGVQIALLNIGKDVKGTQIGIVNVGRDVKGAQIGVVNVARDVKGAGIGLLSFEKEGRHDLLLFTSEADLANLEFRFGGDTLYTLFGGGGTGREGYPGHFYATAGLGVHVWPLRPVWLDLDATASAYAMFGSTQIGDQGIDGGPFSRPPTPVYRARATVGVQVVKQFAPFVGASMNVRYPTDDGQAEVAPEWIRDGEVVGWPGFFAGVQF